MFDFFKKNNVVKFPDIKEPPEYVAPPEPATVFYRLGVTDKNRIAFQMGYTEITLTKAGVENLIKQLDVFKEQLDDTETEDEL
jgi:hypothetical protein